MEYVAWYFIITGVCSLGAAALFCWYGYHQLDLHDVDDVQSDEHYVDYIKREHKRLEELWLWRLEDDGNN